LINSALIHSIVALLSGGAVFAYLLNVCNCDFRWQQWTFVTLASLGVAVGIWIVLALVRGIGRLAFRGRRTA
jgi:hypothetical protein